MRIIVAGVVVAAMCGSASAQVDLSGSAGAIASDNVYRIPDATPDPSGVDRRDVVTTFSAVASATTVSGNWTGTFQAEAAPTIYVRNRDLNHVAYDLSADGLRRTPASLFHINAAFSRRQTSFAEFRSFELNQQQRAVFVVDASHAVLSDFRVVVRGSYLRSTNSAVRAKVIDVERVSGGGGIGYYSPADNFVTIEGQYLDARGLTPRLVMLDAGPSATYRSSFAERRGLARVHWAPTVAFVLDFEGGYADHDDRSVFNNDISGIVWDTRIRWLPRDALRLRGDVRRGFETQDNLYTNGIVVTSIGLGLEGDLSELETVSLDLTSQDRRFRFDPLAAGFTGDRRDRTLLAGASISRALGTACRIVASAGYERRTSTQAQQRFNVFSTGLTLTYRRPRSSPSSMQQ